MTGSKRTTIKDIALKAGLSTASVSQALRPRIDSNIKIPEETVHRIKSIAAELDYRPHAGARSIRASNFNNLGFFLAKAGDLTHSPDGYIAGVHDAADEIGYRTTLIRLPHHAETIQAKLPTIFDEHNLDALIICSYHEVTKLIHKKLSKHSLPIVYLNDKHLHNSVYLDDVHGSEQMTQHLIKRGYRSICYTLRKLPSNPSLSAMHHSAADRLQGFKNATKAAGVTAHISQLLSEEVVGPQFKVTEEWWESVKHHDAIYAYDDDLANMIARFLYTKGLRIPDDIALVGYNGDYGSLSAWKNLTTMQIPSYEMGRAAAELACKLMKAGYQKSLPSLSIAPKLIIGDTTR